jgi:hypothetical protein
MSAPDSEPDDEHENEDEDEDKPRFLTARGLIISFNNAMVLTPFLVA